MLAKTGMVPKLLVNCSESGLNRTQPIHAAYPTNHLQLFNTRGRTIPAKRAMMCPSLGVILEIIWDAPLTDGSTHVGNKHDVPKLLVIFNVVVHAPSALVVNKPGSSQSRGLERNIKIRRISGPL